MFRNRFSLTSLRQGLARLMDRLRVTPPVPPPPDPRPAEDASRWRLAVEASDDGLWDWDLVSGRCFYSPRWKAMLGLADDAVGDSFEEWSRRVHPDDLARVDAAVQDHLAGRSPDYRCDYRMRRQDGSDLWVRSRGRVVQRGADGSALRMVGLQADISALQRAERELARSHALLHDVLEHLPCGLSVFDAELRLVASNPQLRRLLDLPDTLFDAPQPHFEDFLRFNAARGEYGAAGSDDALRDFAQRFGSATVAFQLERVRPDGTVLEIRNAPLPGGGVVSTYVDISARRRSEARAARSDALLCSAIDAMDEGVVLYDPDERLVYCNARFRQIYAGIAELIVPGVAFETLLRADAERGGLLPAAGQPEADVDAQLANFRTGQITLQQQRSDGSWLRMVQRRMADGHSIGLRIDVTGLVHAEAQALRATQAKSRFLASVSHEIRTPMNAIIGAARLLEQEPLTPQQAGFAQVMRHSGRLLLAIVDDVLDLSRIEAGRTELAALPFALAPLLDGLAGVARILADGKPVAIGVEFAPGLPDWYAGDPDRIEQVLNNLLANAVKFTGAGQITLRVEPDPDGPAAGPGRIRLRCLVSDTGIGIAGDRLDSIFEPFGDGRSMTARAQGGAGLGLSISRRLARLMDGEIAVRSRPGAGSVFSFSLVLGLARPPVWPAAPAPDPQRRPAASPLAGRRVLMVEDNVFNRQVLRTMLERLGLEVDQAVDGDDAVESFRFGSPYDAVLMDLHLPGRDGFDCARALRALPGGADAPILAISANVLSTTRDACLAAGMSDYLAKPVEPEALQRALCRWILGTEAAAPTAAAPLPPSDPVSAADALPARLPGLDLALAARWSGGRASVLRDLLARLLLHAAGGPDAIAERTGCAELDAAAQIAHDLGGMGAFVGATALAQAARQLEGELRGGRPDSVLARAALDAVRSALADLARAHDLLPAAPA